MKKTIIAAMSMLAFISSYAQIEKGSSALGVNAGAGIGLLGYQNQLNKVFQINIQPTYEYFVNKNLSLGVAIGLGFQQQTSTNNSPSTSNLNQSNEFTQTYNLGIQLKKYWLVSPKLGFTLTPQLMANYYESNISYDYFNYSVFNQRSLNYNYWYHSALLNFGALYFVKPNIAIEAQTNLLNYTYFPKINNNDTRDQHVFTLLAFQNSLTVGVKYIWGNNKSEVKP